MRQCFKDKYITCTADTENDCKGCALYEGKYMSLKEDNSTSEKAEADFCTTNPEMVLLFIKRALEDGLFQDMQNQTIWDCTCGNGNIAEVLRDYFPLSIVRATDLVYRGYGVGNVDFLKASQRAKMIITNPPSSLLNDFIRHGLVLTDRYLILLSKIQTLDCVDIKELLEKSPLKYIYVHSTRQATWKDRQHRDHKSKKWATTMFLAWFVWDKTYTGEPVLRFL